MTLRIKDWNEHFETCESRKLKKLAWVPIPNKMDGEGYTALIDHPNGAAHLGAWLAILEIASKQEPRENRGNLPGGSSHDIGMICRVLGRISRLPASVFEEALPRLLHHSIGWVEVFCIQQKEVVSSGEFPGVSGESPGVSGESAALPAANRIEGNRIEEKNTCAPNGACSLPSHQNGATPSEKHPKKRKPAGRSIADVKILLGDRIKWWDSFWEVYPRHDGTLAAMDAFERKIRDEKLAREVYRGAKRFRDKCAADAASQGDKAPSIKWAQGWLNEERWVDGPVVLKPNGKHEHPPVPKSKPWRPDPWNEYGADLSAWNFSDEEKARMVRPDPAPRGDA